ncbi:20041_t:CDS:2 [Dentiscutata erythropus]|uniref:20041_t:CDS:1 n=1 Tax=Dentiscutata erythropus TaxID=1348616 RepID=A0A9N9DCV0_9GLOM|nr:20041_t:CDS:2 [Dentiscutata erythropus]
MAKKYIASIVVIELLVESPYLLKSIDDPSLDLVLKLKVSLVFVPSLRISSCFSNNNKIKNLILKNIFLLAREGGIKSFLTS